MNNRKKSKKLLIIATTLMIIALASVLTVYAAVIIGTFNGNAVTINDIATGTVEYSTDGTTWSANPSALNVSSTLYARFTLTSTSYSGSATVNWKLQEDISGTWTDQTSSAPQTTVTVTAGSQTTPIYVTADGTLATSNYNWGGDISSGGSYRVVAIVSAS